MYSKSTNHAVSQNQILPFALRATNDIMPDILRIPGDRSTDLGSGSELDKTADYYSDFSTLQKPKGRKVSPIDFDPLEGASKPPKKQKSSSKSAKQKLSTWQTIAEEKVKYEKQSKEGETETTDQFLGAKALLALNKFITQEQPSKPG